MDHNTYKIVTAYWRIKELTRVDNGFIVTIQSPNEDCEIYETFVFECFDDVIAFLKSNFKLGKE